MKDLEILGVLACSTPLAPVATRPLEHIKMVNILNLGVQYDKRNLIFLDSMWKGKSTLVKVNLLEQKLELSEA